MKRFLFISLMLFTAGCVHAQVNFSSTLLTQNFESSTDYTQYFEPNKPPDGDSLGQLVLQIIDTPDPPPAGISTANINTDNTNYLALTRPQGGLGASLSPVFFLVKPLTSAAANVSKFVFDLAGIPAAGAAQNSNAAHLALGNDFNTANSTQDSRYIVRTTIGYPTGAPGTTPYFFIRQPANAGNGEFRSVLYTGPTKFVIITNNTANPVTYYTPNADGSNSANTAKLNAYSYSIYTGGNIVQLNSGATGNFENIPNWVSGPAAGTPINGLKITGVPGNTSVAQFTLTLDNLNITYDASALPVSFAEIQSTIKNDILSINWVTVSEQNNNHFNIWASSDGSGWQKIGTIASLATEGNSSMPLSYNFSMSIKSFSVAGISLLSFLFLMVPFHRRGKFISIVLFFASITFFIVSCSKYQEDIDNNVNSKLFVRIEQVDKDGSSKFTKVQKVIIE